MSRRSSPSIRIGAYASPALKGALLATSAATLAACEADQTYIPEDTAAYSAALGADGSAVASAFQSVSECVAAGNDQQKCATAEAEAKAASGDFAPRYESLADCQNDFDTCQPAQAAGIANAGGSNVFVPFLTGFLISEAIDEIGDSYERKRYPGRAYAPLYRTRDGSLVNGSGVGIPSFGSHYIGRTGHQALTQKPSSVTRYGLGRSQTTALGSVAGSKTSTLSSFRSSASYSSYKASSSSSISRGGFGSSGRSGGLG